MLKRSGLHKIMEHNRNVTAQTITPLGINSYSFSVTILPMYGCLSVCLSIWLSILSLYMYVCLYNRSGCLSCLSVWLSVCVVRLSVCCLCFYLSIHATFFCSQFAQRLNTPLHMHDRDWCICMTMGLCIWIKNRLNAKVDARWPNHHRMLLHAAPLRRGVQLTPSPWIWLPNRLQRNRGRLFHGGGNIFCPTSILASGRSGSFERRRFMKTPNDAETQ